MAKPEWGTKRLCPNCGARFYDFMREPITCPACGTVLDLEVISRTRRPRGGRVAAGASPSTEETDLETDETEVATERDDDESESDDTDLADSDGESEDDESGLIEDADDLGDDDVSDVIDEDIDDESERDR